MSDELSSLNSTSTEIQVQVVVHEILRHALQHGAAGFTLERLRTLKQVATELTHLEAAFGQALAAATSKLLDISELSVERHLQAGEGLWEFLFGVRPSVAEARARTHLKAVQQDLIDGALSYTDKVLARRLQLLDLAAHVEQQRELAVEALLPKLLPSSAVAGLLPQAEIRVEGQRTTPLRILRDDE